MVNDLVANIFASSRTLVLEKKKSLIKKLKVLLVMLLAIKMDERKVCFCALQFGVFHKMRKT